MMGHSCYGNASSLAHYVAPADWVRDAEQHAAQAHGITLADLMQRAGQAAFNRIRQYYPLCTSLADPCVDMAITVATGMWWRAWRAPVAFT
ncbi:Nicotinamide nucleotide repair protein [Edwardsiella tarda]|nr:Nicotinamide nucleotide repair protein [Edwardsiella tarda]